MAKTPAMGKHVEPHIPEMNYIEALAQIRIFFFLTQGGNDSRRRSPVEEIQDSFILNISNCKTKAQLERLL